MAEEVQELMIHPNLKQLLPEPTLQEIQLLTESLENNGYDPRWPIITWRGYIADGHHRYQICQELGIPFATQELDPSMTLDDVAEWIVRIQISRRNIPAIQKIKITERYREAFAAWNKKAQQEGGRIHFQKKNSALEEVDETEKMLPPNLGEASVPETPRDRETNSKLAEIAGVSPETYRKAAKVLNSDDEELKEELLSGKKSITGAYNEHQNKKKAEKQIIGQTDNEQVHEICHDMKSEPVATAESIEHTALLMTDTIENSLQELSSCVQKVEDPSVLTIILDRLNSIQEQINTIKKEIAQ